MEEGASRLKYPKQLKKKIHEIAQREKLDLRRRLCLQTTIVETVLLESKEAHE